MEFESLREARGIAEEVRYHMEERMPVRFGSSESSFTGYRPVKSFHLLIMLLYATFRVLHAMAQAHIESNELSQRLLDRLIVQNLKIKGK
jgi:hypothetical protein